MSRGNLTFRIIAMPSRMELLRQRDGRLRLLAHYGLVPARLYVNHDEIWECIVPLTIIDSRKEPDQSSTYHLFNIPGINDCALDKVPAAFRFRGTSSEIEVFFNPKAAVSDIQYEVALQCLIKKLSFVPNKEIIFV